MYQLFFFKVSSVSPGCLQMRISTQLSLPAPLDRSLWRLPPDHVPSAWTTDLRAWHISPHTRARIRLKSWGNVRSQDLSRGLATTYQLHCVPPWALLLHKGLTEVVLEERDVCDGRGGQTDCARDRLPCSLSRGSLPGGRRPSLEASDQGQEGESGHRSGSGQEASDPRPGDPRLLHPLHWKLKS